MNAGKNFKGIDPEAKINLLIEHQCPQCGAPAVLWETDRLFSCEFCRVKSYLIAKDYFRFFLPSKKASENEELLYIPFWRFKGMLFSSVASGVIHKFIDISHQAIESHYFPVSVGLRSQALKLRFVSPETSGRFLKPTQSLDKVFRNIEGRLRQSLPKPVLHQSRIGDAISLLYSPIYIKNRIYDAVVNEPISPLLPDEFDIAQFQGGPPKWRLRFLPTLCPRCGWNLEGQRDTLVLFCNNCHSAWYPAGKSLKSLKFGKYPMGENFGIYLPFWRIKADIKGINLKSYADLIQVANLPKVCQEGWEDIGFRFWVPAFKVRPRVFLRLSTHFTLSQPRKSLIDELPEHRYHAVTLPVTEAVESLKINLASFLKPAQRLIECLQDIKIDAQSFVLVYVPFADRHHEYVQSDFQIALNKNILSLSKNL